MIKHALLIGLATLLLAPAAHATQVEGGYVRVLPSPRVYRIVGGAPLYVSVCPPETNCQPLEEDPNLGAYGQVPRDGALTTGGSDGGTYRWAGGAPLWISRCDYGPGCGGTLKIDDYSYIDWEHVRAVPADGTVIRNVDDGGYYRFAGGAPLLVRCDIGAGCANPTAFDGGTFLYLGSVTPGRQNMRSYPADGATVMNADDGSYYRFAGGAPLPIAPCGGCATALVDTRTFALAGTATPSQPHMAAAPADGTFVNAGANYYRVAGGAWVALADCGPLNGCPGSVAVDQSTISSLGGGRLHAAPKDGTVLRGLPSGNRWEIVGGRRQQTFAGSGGIDVDDGAIAAIPTVASATPPVIVPIATFSPTIFATYRVRAGRTIFTSLGVRDVPAAAKVLFTCKGRGCPYKKKTYKPKKGKVDAVKDFKKAKLANHATMTIAITGSTGARKRQTFKFRGNKLPTRRRECAPAGGKLKVC